MFDHSIFRWGRVTYNRFCVDPTVPLAQQVDELTEDLLQVAYENDVVLDVGWYPEFSPDGHFRVVVVTDCNWEEPRFNRRCGNLRN